MNKVLKRLIPVLIIGAAIVAFIYMKSSKPEQAAVEVKEKVWVVNSLPLQIETLAAVQTLYGVVQSNAMVKAAAPVSAVVERVAVQPGDEIQKGDLLVALSADDLRLPLQQARADEMDAKAQYQLQKLTIEANHKRLAHEQKVLSLKKDALVRAKALLSKNLASQATIDVANEALVRQEYTVVGVQLAVAQGDAQLAQTRARLLKAQAALKQAEINQERGVVKAPFSGRVAAVNVSAGDRVNPNSVLVSYYALDSMELKAKLPLSSLNEAEAALEHGRLLQAKYSQGTVDATLPLLRLAGEATTSGVDAYFGLSKELYTKRPGELMEVYFQGEAMQKVAAVPYSSIYGNDRVYLLKEGRLQSLKIQLKGEVMRDGKLMALIAAPQLQDDLKVLVTHLPNAINGLKVSEVQ